MQLGQLAYGRTDNHVKTKVWAPLARAFDARGSSAIKKRGMSVSERTTVGTGVRQDFCYPHFFSISNGL